jgi:thioredoxin 1
VIQTRGEIAMKSAADKMWYLVIALIILLSMSTIPLPTEGKELPAQETISLPTLIDLGKGTCTPCKMMKPILNGLKKEYAGILNVEIIDIRDQPEALKKYNVRGIPFQIVFDASGKELKRHYGYMDKKEILAMLKSVGIDLKKAPAQNKK